MFTMFIHRIYTRIHKLKPMIYYSNNFKLNQNYVTRQLSTNRVAKNVIYTSTRRNISTHSIKKPNIEKLKLQDKVPNNYELVYRCTMAPYLYAAQISATVGIVFVFVIGLYNLVTDPNRNYLISYNSIKLQNLINSDLQLYVFSIGFVLINIAVMTLVSQFPVRIYFNKDLKKYYGVLFGKIPKIKRVLEFSTGDVVHKPVNGILPWGEFRYKIKTGKSIIMLDHYFRKPDDMNIMLGYTKL